MKKKRKKDEQQRLTTSHDTLLPSAELHKPLYASIYMSKNAEMSYLPLYTTAETMCKIECKDIFRSREQSKRTNLQNRLGKVPLWLLARLLLLLTHDPQKHLIQRRRRNAVIL